MNKNVIYGVGGLLIGVLIAGTTATLAVNNNNKTMMKMLGMHTSDSGMMNDDDMTMSQMATNLQGKTGDDFDKTFLAEMIDHHQGAITMANLAKQNAKHQQVKDLANDIVTAQSKEIDMMQSWQEDWGYRNVPTKANDTQHMMQ